MENKKKNSLFRFVTNDFRKYLMFVFFLYNLCCTAIWHIKYDLPFILCNNESIRTNPFLLTSFYVILSVDVEQSRAQ